MHEMSLAMGIMQIVGDAAKASGTARVQSVRLEIGRLASVEVEALRFCFEAVTHGSLAQGAALEIVAVPGQGWCLPCGATVAMAALWGACPRCGSHQVQPTGGTEMRVKEIEIE